MIDVCRKMVVSQKRHTSLIIIAVVASVIFLVFFNLVDANAQYSSYWSEQKKIPFYEIFNNEQPPYLIADNNHKVYAFNSQFVGDVDAIDSPKAVFYREWTLANGWTYPNDILADINGTIEVLGVSSDESDKVHLIFQNNSGEIYYTEAFLANASNPKNWSVPVTIAENSLTVRPGIPNIAAIANDADGKKLLVIYSGAQYGNGLYVTYSVDYGKTWSSPYPVYLTGDETMVVTSPSLYTGHSGFFHAVWSTFDDKGFGRPGFYAKFDLNVGKWTEPVELDAPGILSPSVIEYKGSVFISYHHSRTNGRWWRRSGDDGETWTSPVQLSPRHTGTNGGVSFVVDSNETLYAFFAQRTDEDGNHGMWQTIWGGATWSLPEAVVKGQAIVDVDGGNNFDPTFARAIVSNGNVVLVTWGTDGSVGTNGAWYSYKVLDSPELPSAPLSTPLPEVSLVPQNEFSATSIPTHTTGLPDNLKRQNETFVNSPNMQIFIGLISGAFLMVVLIIVVFHKRDR